jgi:hypothetical protein
MNVVDLIYAKESRERGVKTEHLWGFVIKGLTHSENVNRLMPFKNDKLYKC